MEIIIRLLLLVIFLTFIGCALYGACLLVGKLCGLGTSSAVPNPSDSPLNVTASSTPENATELNATCRQLVRMLRRGDLDQATYDQLRNKICLLYTSPSPRD